MKDILIPTLEADDIEVKIKQVSAKGAFALLYKTARTDMRYLDEAYGANNWQNDYQMIGDMLFCTISIWDEDKQQWIKKQSNGIESREDGEGNEIKGLASDCMKRAGFMVGIGRELYSSPKIFLNVATKQEGEFKGKPVYKLEDPWAKYVVTNIHCDSKRRIDKLVICNEKTGEVVYRYGDGTSALIADNTRKNTAPKATAPKQDTPKQEVKNPEPPKPIQKQDVPKAEVTTSDTIPNPNEAPYMLVIKDFNKRHGLDRKKFVALYNQGVQNGKIVTATTLDKLNPDEWIKLIATMENLFTEGFFKVA